MWKISSQTDLMLSFIYSCKKKRLHTMHIYSEMAISSNYKNKHSMPLCFYIFRSLLTPFIRYVLTSRVLSFVFNESIFFAGFESHAKSLE